MPKFIGALVCWWTDKHLRGKPVENDEDYAPAPIFSRTHHRFACPRCGRETRYKLKPKDENGGAPSDGSPHFQEN